jgi:hypothetical protein
MRQTGRFVFSIEILSQLRIASQNDVGIKTIRVKKSSLNNCLALVIDKLLLFLFLIIDNVEGSAGGMPIVFLFE